MPIEPVASYVFDLGYYDYARWAALDAAVCRISPAPNPTPGSTWWKNWRSPKAATSSPTASAFPLRQASSRCNAMRDAVREVRVKTDTGKVLPSCRTISTPALKESLIFIADAGPSNCSSLGQADPQDRPLRRYLRECHSYPDCSRAHRLFAAAPGSAAQKHIQSPIVFARSIRANLMHRRQIDHLLTTPPKIAQDQRQMSLQLC